MATRDLQDDAELDASISKVESLYQKLPREEFSKDVEDQIMKVARGHVSSRRTFQSSPTFQSNWWIRFIRRPVIVAAGAVLVIFAAMYGLQRPALVTQNEIENIQQLFEVDGPITMLAERVIVIKEMEPASNKWNTEVDKLIKEAGIKIDDYENMVAPLEKTGRTNDAEILRNLTDDLRQLFEKRDPNWNNKIRSSN